MKKLPETLTIYHYTRDNMGKETRKRIPHTHKYQQGDTARWRLHKETIYGAIDRGDEIKYVVRQQLASVEDKDAKKIVDKIVDDVVRQKVLDAIAEHGSLSKAVAAGIWMNRELNIPIKKVRCIERIKNPIALRKPRDVSRHEHKRAQYVVNESNYAAGIYVGVNNKGKEKREATLINYLNAVKLNNHELLPLSSNSGYPLRLTLKIGTMALLYEKSPEEIYKADKKELIRRLYKIKGLSSMTVNNSYYVTIELRHSQEARSSGELKSKNGAYKTGEEFRPCITMLHTQFNALVEGVDFKMDEDGEIHFE